MVIANRWTQNPWSPLREWQEVQREFAKLLGEARAPQHATSRNEQFELRTGHGGALVRAALPGFASGDVEISAERDLLTISARSTPTTSEHRENQEPESSTSSSFQRTLRLPFRIDAENTVATMKDGMLEVRLPKASEDSPKKIAVRAHLPADDRNPSADLSSEEN